MVDRIVPATTAADLAALERDYGYRDAAAVGGEPFRQWVIETRFAGRTPPWDLAGASFVADVTPFEQLKMRVLNAAQSTLAYLGVLAGHAHTCDAVADPRLEAFIRAHAGRGERPDPRPGPRHRPARLPRRRASPACTTRAIRHRCHQIATDGSQKLPQRLINPAAERLARGAADRPPRDRRSPPGWPTSSAPPTASAASGRPRIPRPPASPPSPTAPATTPAALVAGILALDTVFDPALAARADFRAPLAAALAGPAFARPDRRRPTSRDDPMKLGLLTAPFPDTPLLEVADWARSAGFEALEIACWPRASGPTRRYAGTSHIDVAEPLAEAAELVAALAERGLAISALGYYPNPLHPDADHREAVDRPPEAGDRRREPHGRRPRQHLLRRRRGASTSTPTGRTRSTVWPDIVAHARDQGVKLAFENCPMIFSDRRVAGRPQHRLFAA